jgi:hypothetical protein
LLRALITASIPAWFQHAAVSKKFTLRFSCDYGVLLASYSLITK